MLIAFQADAFQNDAFQVSGVAPVFIAAWAANSNHTIGMTIEPE